MLACWLVCFRVVLPCGVGHGRGNRDHLAVHALAFPGLFLVSSPFISNLKYHDYIMHTLARFQGRRSPISSLEKKKKNSWLWRLKSPSSPHLLSAPTPVPALPRQCFVLSLGHLSCFLSSARSRSAHLAVSSLGGELRGGLLAAELAAREAVAAAAAAQRVARLASAEALTATARAASAAASARNEGSFLLEEVRSAWT